MESEVKNNKYVWTVRFKSYQENWLKEYQDVKRNTIRKQDNPEDRRFELLNSFIARELNLLDIEIENKTTCETFTRRITDVTKFDDYYVISW
jgi:hypothetical protein